LWRDAIDKRRSILELAPLAHQQSVFDRNGVFGVGLFEEDELLSIAVAMPARADDGRSLHNVPGLVHISSVATAPDRWGHGYAARVVEAVLSHARRRGYARAQLWTHATNAGALRLYEKHGFVRSGRVSVDANDEPIVHLIREVPAAAWVNRPAARMICLDPDDRMLLMHWRDPDDGHQVYEPPGGGIEPGEDPDEAVLREWNEETGLPTPAVEGAPTRVSRDTYWNGGRIVTDEWFYLGRLGTSVDLVPAALTDVEAVSLLGWAWVTAAELDTLDDPAEPDLAPIVDRLTPG
jgi:8-oxo-dGTP pyrophosphatase MutT (NUDIX family)/GNAT superfamily N-acetyltransferase